MSDYERYLFRGKEKDSGKWIYGDLRHISDGHGGYILCIVDNTNGRNNDVTGVEVLPETVGQYTGLTDKNGKRIFEGDIVHCVSKLDSADMVIIFECGQFRMILAEKYHEYQTNVGYYDINCFAKEVIGNIHDNPELLGGENNGINR